MKNFFLFFILSLIFHNVFGQEQKYSTKRLSGSYRTYLCIMEKSVGFQYYPDTNKWNYQNSEVEDQKFILELDQRNSGKFYRFGSNNKHKKIIYSKCNKSRVTRLIECNGRLGDVNFNDKSNLVTYSFNFGYSVDNKSVWKDNSLGPFISIGKCSLLNLNIK